MAVGVLRRCEMSGDGRAGGQVGVGARVEENRESEGPTRVRLLERDEVVCRELSVGSGHVVSGGLGEMKVGLKVAKGRRRRTNNWFPR